MSFRFLGRATRNRLGLPNRPPKTGFASQPAEHAEIPLDFNALLAPNPLGIYCFEAQAPASEGKVPIFQGQASSDPGRARRPIARPGISPVGRNCPRLWCRPSESQSPSDKMKILKINRTKLYLSLPTIIGHMLKARDHNLRRGIRGNIGPIGLCHGPAFRFKESLGEERGIMQWRKDRSGQRRMERRSTLMCRRERSLNWRSMSMRKGSASTSISTTFPV